MAIGAVAFFRFPARKLKVVGVTGTDGKTTTVHLIGQILKKAGLKVAIVSSVGAWLGEKEIDTGFHVTTPDSWSLQKLLRQIVDLGFTHVILEATSHGLDQHRLWGCNFQIGVVTNVTHEHLDYHGTWERYLAAKAKLFNGVKVAVLNRDDKSFEYLDTKIQRYKDTKRVTYGTINKADITPKTFLFKTQLPGEYNLYNCLAAIGVAKNLGVQDRVIHEAIADFTGVVGRLELIDEGQNFQVFVDFAHTPNALEKVLQFLKTQKSQNARLIAVFGCAGLRDIQKRPMMGEISARLADISVFTAEDPRTEDVNQIIEQIMQGALKGGAKQLDPSSSHSFFRIPDRGEAINFAIQKLSRKGDIIVICGKGHERSMCYGTTEYPWSDQDETRKALKKLKNAKAD